MEPAPEVCKFIPMSTRRIKRAKLPSKTRSAKLATGIAGFDEMTFGGLPRGRTTLLVGGPGSGKTIFALQFLVHGAKHCKEPGIFVAFEESSTRIVANAESFGWDLDQYRQQRKLHFVDAQPVEDMVQSGNFDLCGLLSALDSLHTEIKAQRIVIDALDVVLALLPDPAAKRREIYRLHEWLLKHELTAIITAKADGNEMSSILQQPFGFMQFMVDCAVILSHTVALGVSHRNLRVQKYRGSSFDENEAPFLIGTGGMDVAGMRMPGRVDTKVSTVRVSSGVTRLDTMLGGGYFRGACVLITGFSGTAKSTLSGAFAAAACQRGERTLFVSFDTNCNEVVRNLASVNIHLDRYLESGRLRLISARTIAGSAETYLVRIKTLAQEHEARCLVIDPVSTWYRSETDLTSQSVAERLIDWSKGAGITLVCTSLLDEMSSQPVRGSPLPISTLADTWIHLNYLVQAGERNRALSIVKSRGMAHSNQVCELILSDSGVTLTDTYTAGGEVLMGTLRLEKERAEVAMHEAAEVAIELKRGRLAAEEADLVVRLKSLQAELSAKQVEKELLFRSVESQNGEPSGRRSRVKELRGANAVASGRK